MRVRSHAIDAGADAAPGAKGPPQRRLVWLQGSLEPDRRSQASAAVDAYPRVDELRSDPRRSPTVSLVAKRVTIVGGSSVGTRVVPGPTPG
jgi:hypothetical protein